MFLDDLTISVLHMIFLEFSKRLKEIFRCFVFILCEVFGET